MIEIPCCLSSNNMSFLWATLAFTEILVIGFMSIRSYSLYLEKADINVQHLVCASITVVPVLEFWKGQLKCTYRRNIYLTHFKNIKISLPSMAFVSISTSNWDIFKDIIFLQWFAKYLHQIWCARRLASSTNKRIETH